MACMTRVFNASVVAVLGCMVVFAMLAGCTTAPSTTTPTPTVPSGTTAGATTAGTTAAAGGATQLALTAQNYAFDKQTLSAPAGSTVTLTFTNKDSGVPHNFALYTDNSASTAIFKGQIVTGPTTTTYTFTAPSTKGSYFYRCDVHPSSMYGTFTVT
jgi:plastocyanin